MNSFSEFVNLGLTIAGTILLGTLIGKYFNHVAIGIITGVVLSLAYLLVTAFKQK